MAIDKEKIKFIGYHLLEAGNNFSNKLKDWVEITNNLSKEDILELKNDDSLSELNSKLEELSDKIERFL